MDIGLTPLRGYLKTWLEALILGALTSLRACPLKTIPARILEIFPTILSNQATVLRQMKEKKCITQLFTHPHYCT
jgi:hypothetical protein